MGRAAEWLASGLLMLKGYRVLARRARTPFGEIDLIAKRGRRIAFVEVKFRPSLSAAETSVRPGQAGRIAKASEHWLWRHSDLRSHEIGLDCIYVAPWRLPRHAYNALQPL